MENYLFVRRLLAWLSVPLNFNRMVAVSLRVFATLLVPMSLVTFFKAGKAMFELPAESVLGGILFQMFYIVAIYSVVHTLFIRAREIDMLEPSDFHIFPLSSVLARSISEVLAFYVALVAVGGGIYVWFTGKGIGSVLNPPPRFMPVFGDTSFMGGIEFMVGALFSAVAILLAGRLIAAALMLFVPAQNRAPKQEVQDSVFKARSGSGFGG